MVAIDPASADPPEMYRYLIWAEGTSSDCGIELTWYQELWVQGRNWCNPAKEQCGSTEHVVHETFTLTNPNNGRTLILRGGALTRVTWINWYDTLYEYSGARFMGTIPGVGPVFGSPGRGVTYETCQGEYPDNWVCDYETIHESGPNFDDLEAICNYMLGE